MTMRSKNIFRLLFVFIIGLSLVFMFGCGDNNTDNKTNNNGDKQGNVIDDKEKTEKYNYKFLVDGVVLKEETLEKGETISYPVNPTKDGNEEFEYSFEGWDNNATVLDKDEVFNAIFKETKKKYTINFYGLNNALINTQTVEYGSKPYSPYVPDVSATNIYTFEFNSWDKTIESVTGDCDYTAKYNVVREELDSLEGLKISFLGDSITTFYKEGSEYNNIYPDGYRGLNNCLSQSEAINNYYPSHSDTVKTWDQTWWGQLLVSTKMELGIVNALSGSMAYDHYNYENGVVAMQDSRVSTLDDNGVPDIVVVFIGTNDICSSQPSWYGKSEYTTALNTIYEKIHKFCNPYTDVFFVQMYLSKSASSYKARVDMYNEVIASVSTDKNCGVIKYADYLSTVSDQSSVLPDWTHPSLKGCGILARASEKAIKEFYGIPCKIKVV